ncbi:MAG: YHS domain-containing (seleno)protein [Proteobacteria bacterium]|nr:YHS domain-containing (seleno)protein [Pseudomonadota bacterium]
MIKRDIFKTFAALMAVGFLLAMPVAALAKSEVNQSSIGAVAIEGTDPVAYFSEQKAVKGSSEYNHRWKGAQWQFKNAANRDAFAAEPEKYAPQFGGYCAWAVSQGYTAKTDPEAWTVHKGKLYLNYSKGVRDNWAKDIPGNITKAESNWPKVLN